MAYCTAKNQVNIDLIFHHAFALVLFILMLACLLHAGHYADIVVIVVSGLSCTLSASTIKHTPEVGY